MPISEKKLFVDIEKRNQCEKINHYVSVYVILEGFRKILENKEAE